MLGPVPALAVCLVPGNPPRQCTVPFWNSDSELASVGASFELAPVRKCDFIRLMTALGIGMTFILPLTLVRVIVGDGFPV